MSVGCRSRSTTGCQLASWRCCQQGLIVAVASPEHTHSTSGSDGSSRLCTNPLLRTCTHACMNACLSVMLIHSLQAMQDTIHMRSCMLCALFWDRTKEGSPTQQPGLYQDAMINSAAHCYAI